jgi:hypothetical protein
MSFDLAKKKELVAAEDVGVAVAIKDEAGKAVYQDDGTTPVTIHVVGSLSKRYRRVQAVQRGRVMNRAGLEQIANDDETVGEKSLLEQTEAVAACVTGWSAGFTDSGADYPYSEANAIRLLAENPFVQTQLEIAMADHARFFVVSANGSGPS